MNSTHNDKNTSAWRFQVWASFVISFGLTMGGIFNLPIDTWMKDFLLMGVLFTVGSCFGLAKTIRDDHEADKLINRITYAKTEKILSDFE